MIDLCACVLRVGNDATPFLSEQHIPDSMRLVHGSSPAIFAPFPNTSGSALAAEVPSTTVPEKDVRVLMNLGASREKALALLRRTHGNVEMAASLLF
jgi:hypothetical protein